MEININLSDVMQKAREIADAVIVGADRAHEFARLYVKAARLRAEIDRAYCGIGKAVYAAHTGGCIDEAEMDAAFAMLDGKREKLADIYGVMERDICPRCGR